VQLRHPLERTGDEPLSREQPQGSSGKLVMSQATMTWSATNGLGFSFQSNPSGTTSAFAQLGHVRSGVFAMD
jgi:hypothetical protein